MKSLIALCFLTSGCTALVPDEIRPEIEHMSHLTQHYGNNQSNYGSDIANLVVAWHTPSHINIELAEGVDVDRRFIGGGGYGEIAGPREQFTGRVSYSFRVK